MGADRVRAAMAERSWNSFTLAGTYDKVRADDEADLSGALARLVVEAGQPDIVISALPAIAPSKRLLELPFKDARRLHQVVPFALEEHLPFPVDNGTVAFTRVGREGDHTLVMAAMVRKTDLQQHLALLQKAGLDPKTVTLRATRAGRDVHPHQKWQRRQADRAPCRRGRRVVHFRRAGRSRRNAPRAAFDAGRLDDVRRIDGLG